MKVVTAMALVASTTLSLGQVPRLGTTKFVAAKANSVEWNSANTFVAFGDDGGQAAYNSFGIFDCARGEGKTLFAAEDDRKVTTFAWLGGKPIAVVVTTEKSGAVRSILSLDGRTMRSKLLWSAPVAPDAKTTFEIEASPTLPHAIVTFRSGKIRRHLVVALGANDVVTATDLDRAEDEGVSFSGWSKDGTGIYGRGNVSDILLIEEVTARMTAVSALQEDVGPSRKTATATLLSEAPYLNALIFRTRGRRPHPNVDPGTPVLELVPSNGVLRQVRFEAWFEDPPETKATVTTTSMNHRLTFAESTANARALWLTPAVEKPSEGALVSAQAESAWMQPDEKGVAFTVNGVLFYRTITR